MKLSHDECRLFYKLHPALMFYANEKLRVTQDRPADPQAHALLPPEKRLEVRDALHAKPELIDQFVQENPFGFSPEELEIVESWQHAVVGGFYIFRYLAKYTIFLSTETVPKAYGVLALADPLEELIGPYLPRMSDTVLLPFKGKIVYDGLLSGYNLTFGGGIKRMLNEEYKKAKADFGIITSLPWSGEEPEPPEEGEAVIVAYDRSGKAHETWIGRKRETDFPLALSHLHRRLIADALPALANRLKTDEKAARTIRFTLGELQQIATECKAAAPKVGKRKFEDALLNVVKSASLAIERFKDGGVGRIPAAERIYQFKITLKGIKPPIWRRIQVKDCTLDKLHEHIQTAMGWTNSHLHQFEINGVRHGDPELLLEGFEDDPEIVDSLDTRSSKIVPKDGKRFRFQYEYDFGNGWEHEILFEGCLRAEKGTKYPLCLEGARACPPEDVGGIYGYQEYLEALADPNHERHKEFMGWRGPFDPEAFDALPLTKAMRKGLPNWREME
jgi:hypothetical protein